MALEPRYPSHRDIESIQVSILAAVVSQVYLNKRDTTKLTVDDNLILGTWSNLLDKPMIEGMDYSTCVPGADHRLQAWSEL